MKKLLGLGMFLALLYAALLMADPSARTVRNHINLAKLIGHFGILCLAVTPVIITGGIDLSIGAVVGYCATTLAILLNDYHWNPHLAVATVLWMGACIGLLNGLLITKLGLQPFVVTLCGLFIYRGLSRWIADDKIKGLGGTDAFDWYKAVFHDGDLLGIPKFFIIFLVLAGVLAVLLHLSVYGRYWLAIGANEKTAHYSGIRVDRYKILAYVFCSFLCAIFSVLYLTEYNSAAPSEAGNFFELYAIAGAVLGGVSLRGGEGNVLGVIMGTMILWILPNFTRMWGISDKLQYTVIGAALLFGAIVDELLRQRQKVLAFLIRILSLFGKS
jgi:ribose transport system permease protein